MRDYRIAGRGVALVLAAGLLAPLPAEANPLCTWFGRCLFESLGFRIIVVDKETGRPLADVHALAEWVQHGSHGRAGPLMVQDALSDAGGVLTFPSWGPEHGSRLGLMLNLDPAVTLFKPGYRTLLIQNAYPSDMTETTRVRRFGQDGQTFRLEAFRGTHGEWVDQLREAAYPATIGGMSDEELLRFRSSYLERRRRVRKELENIPRTDREIVNFVRAFEDSFRRLEQLRR
jgi:hypothetical protein